MIGTLNPNLAIELRHALDVLEESSHLGLDDEYASRLRDIVLRQIEDAEVALAVRPKGPANVTRATEFVSRLR